MAAYAESVVAVLINFTSDNGTHRLEYLEHRIHLEGMNVEDTLSKVRAISIIGTVINIGLIIFKELP